MSLVVVSRVVTYLCLSKYKQNRMRKKIQDHILLSCVYRAYKLHAHARNYILVHDVKNSIYIWFLFANHVFVRFSTHLKSTQTVNQSILRCQLTLGAIQYFLMDKT